MDNHTPTTDAIAGVLIDWLARHGYTLKDADGHVMRRLLPCLVLLGLITAAAPAEAATVSISATAMKVKFKAAATEANRLELTQEGPLTIRFTDLEDRYEELDAEERLYRRIR